MSTTTKKELIERIADQTQQKRATVKKTVQAFLDNVIEELSKGNRLEFRDFGVFEIKERAARVAQNPKTLERVPVPAKRTVKFKVGRRMREAMDASAEAQAQSTKPATGQLEPKPAASTREDRDVVGSIGSGVHERAAETAGAR